MRRRFATLVLACLIPASYARAADGALGLSSPESKALYAELSRLYVLLEPRPAPREKLEEALTRFEALAARIPAELSVPLERERLARGADIVRGLFEKRLPSAACRLGPLYASAFSAQGKDAARTLECLSLEAAVREPAPDADALRKRLEDLRGLMTRRIIDPGEAKALAERLEKVSASVRALEAPARAAKEGRLPDPSPAADLRDALASPGGLDRLYDNGASKSAAKDPVPAMPEPASAGAPAPVSAPTAIRPLSAPVPSPAAARPAAPAEAEESLSDRLASAFDLVAEPFSNLTEKGRRSYFEKKRAAWSRRLAASPWKDADPSGSEPGLKRYLEERALYQIFVQEALAGDAVADGTRFAPWEVGSTAEGAVAAVRSSFEHGGETYRGLTLEYANGSTRFEGSASRSSLITARLPGQEREVRTEIRYGADGQKARTETSVIDTKTGKLIERELVDIAAALLTRTLYEGGEPVRRETLDSNTGVRLIEDLKTGLSARRGADGRTEVTSSDPKKTGWVSQQGTSDHSGFHVERISLENGNTAVAVSPGVFKVLDADGRQLGFELDMSGLADGAQGADRAALSWKLAEEAVAALGYKDEDKAYSRPLHTFLSETWAKDGRFTDVKFFFNAQGEFLLKYTLLSGERRYEQARFGMATPFQGQTRAHRALLVMRPQHIPAGSTAQPTVSGIKWNEYLDDGGYNHWHSMFGTEVPEWYQVWKDPKMVEWIYLQQWRRKGDPELGAWDQVRNQLWTVDKRSLVDQPSTDSGIVRAAGDALSSLGRMTQAAPSELIYQLGGGDAFRRASAQAYGKAPAMTYFLDADDFWRRVPASERPAIEARAQAYRARALGYFGHIRGKTDDRTYWHMLAYPYNHDELFDALRENFTLSHARRVIREVERTLAFAEASLPARNKGDAVTTLAGSDPYRSGTLDLRDRALDPVDGLRRMAPPAAIQAAQNTGRLLSGGLYGDWVAQAASGMNPADGGPGDGSGGAGSGSSAGPGDVGALGKTAREAPSPEARGNAMNQLQELKKNLLKNSRPPELTPQIPPQQVLAPAQPGSSGTRLAPSSPALVSAPEPTAAPAVPGPVAPAQPAAPRKAEPTLSGKFNPMKPAKPVKVSPSGSNAPRPDVPAPAQPAKAGGAPGGSAFTPNLPDMSWEPPQPPKGPPSSSHFDPRWLLPTLLLAKKKSDEPRFQPAPTWQKLAAVAVQQTAQAFPQIAAIAPVAKVINDFAGTPAPTLQPANVTVARQAPTPTATAPSLSPVATAPTPQPTPVVVRRASPEPQPSLIARAMPTLQRVANAFPQIAAISPIAKFINDFAGAPTPALQPANVTVARQAPTPTVTQPSISPVTTPSVSPSPISVGRASPEPTIEPQNSPANVTVARQTPQVAPTPTVTVVQPVPASGLATVPQLEPSNVTVARQSPTPTVTAPTVSPVATAPTPQPTPVAVRRASPEPQPSLIARAMPTLQRLTNAFPQIAAIAPIAKVINDFANAPAPALQPANVTVARQAPTPTVTQPSISPVTTPSVSPSPITVGRASPEPTVSPVAQPQLARQTPHLAPTPTVTAAQPVPASGLATVPQLEPADTTVARQSPTPTVTAPTVSPVATAPTLQPSPVAVRRASPEPQPTLLARAMPTLQRVVNTFPQIAAISPIAKFINDFANAPVPALQPANVTVARQAPAPTGTQPSISPVTTPSVSPSPIAVGRASPQPTIDPQHSPANVTLARQTPQVAPTPTVTVVQPVPASGLATVPQLEPSNVTVARQSPTLTVTAPTVSPVATAPTLQPNPVAVRRASPEPQPSLIARAMPTLQRVANAFPQIAAISPIAKVINDFANAPVPALQPANVTVARQAPAPTGTQPSISPVTTPSVSPSPIAVGRASPQPTIDPQHSPANVTLARQTPQVAPTPTVNVAQPVPASGLATVPQLQPADTTVARQSPTPTVTAPSISPVATAPTFQPTPVAVTRASPEPQPSLIARAMPTLQRLTNAFPQIAAIAPIAKVISDFANAPVPALQPANVTVARQAPAPTGTQPSISPVTTPSVSPSPIAVGRASPQPTIDPQHSPANVTLARQTPQVAPTPTVTTAQPVPASGLAGVPQLQPADTTVARQSPTPTVTPPSISPVTTAPTPQPTPVAVRRASPEPQPTLLARAMPTLQRVVNTFPQIAAISPIAKVISDFAGAPAPALQPANVTVARQAPAPTVSPVAQPVPESPVAVAAAAPVPTTAVAVARPTPVTAAAPTPFVVIRSAPRTSAAPVQAAPVARRSSPRTASTPSIEVAQADPVSEAAPSPAAAASPSASPAPVEAPAPARPAPAAQQRPAVTAQAAPVLSKAIKVLLANGFAALPAARSAALPAPAVAPRPAAPVSLPAAPVVVSQPVPAAALPMPAPLGYATVDLPPAPSFYADLPAFEPLRPRAAVKVRSAKRHLAKHAAPRKARAVRRVQAMAPAPAKAAPVVEVFRTPVMAPAPMPPQAASTAKEDDESPARSMALSHPKNARTRAAYNAPAASEALERSGPPPSATAPVAQRKSAPLPLLPMPVILSLMFMLALLATPRERLAELLEGAALQPRSAFAV